MRRCSACSSIRTSVTAASSSVALTVDLRMRDEAGNGDDLVPAHDERPSLSVGTGDLGVDENVLDLLAPPGKAVAWPPASYLKPCECRADAPLTPADLAGEIDRAALEPEPVVLAHGLDAGAEIDAFRAFGRREQLSELRRQRRARIERAEDVLICRRMQQAQQRQDLVADEPALRVRVARVDAEGEPLGGAVLLRLGAPHGEQRMDDAVLAARVDPGRAAAGGEPVEDRLDLVGGGMASPPPATR